MFPPNPAQPNRLVVFESDFEESASFRGTEIELINRADQYKPVWMGVQLATEALFTRRCVRSWRASTNGI
jgi:hypothetical protein